MLLFPSLWRLKKQELKKVCLVKKNIFKKILVEVSENILNVLWIFFIQRQQTTYTPAYLTFPSISGLPHWKVQYMLPPMMKKREKVLLISNSKGVNMCKDFL